MSLSRLAAAAAFVTVSLFAQGANCGVRFLTSDAGGSGQSGIMFDIENVSQTPVSICGFDMNIDAGAIPVNLEVWVVTSGGTMVGVQSTPSAWTLVAIANGVPSLGINTSGTSNTLTPFPAAMNIGIAPGQRLGVALAVANSTEQNYTVGTAATPVGALASTDGTVNAYVGYGKAFITGSGPFGTSFGDATGGRIPNVRIGYTTPNLPPLWELNSPASNLDVDGVATLSPTRCLPAIGINASGISRTRISPRPTSASAGISRSASRPPSRQAAAPSERPAGNSSISTSPIRLSGSFSASGSPYRSRRAPFRSRPPRLSISRFRWRTSTPHSSTDSRSRAASASRRSIRPRPWSFPETS
jgi:hypothetical protein